MHYKFIGDRSQLFLGSHLIHTPRGLVEKVLDRVNCQNRTVLIEFNVEFVISMVHTYNIQPSIITFYSDHQNKTLIAQSLGCRVITEIEDDMKFDVVIGNPPYTNGSKLLYTKFFAQALELGDTVVFVMPVQLDSLHDKLKKHNKLLKKHLVELGENVSDHFNVGYNTIHIVTASKRTVNEVEESQDPIETLPLLYPKRSRLNFIKGDTDTGQTVDDAGVPAIDKVHKGDTVIWRRIPQKIYDKSKKKSKAPYLVCVNHTPSQGRFNCAIIKNTDPSYTWAIWTFVLEAETLKEAELLQAWLKSDEIVNEVKRMFSVRGDAFYTVSKKILNRLPYYE